MRFGMDYGGTNLKLAVFTEDGEAVSFIEVPIKKLIKDGKIIDGLVDVVTEFTGGHTLKAGGLAVKGMVDIEKGMVVDDIGAGALLAGVNIQKIFSDALGIPVAIDNDARSYAWGEYLFGAGKGSKVMVCMTLGTGLGCSLVADGRPYEGADPLGGILGGHISIDRNGPECACGSRGCLELYCSATALTRQIKSLHPEIDTDDILPAFFDLVVKKGSPYTTLLREFQNNLALGIVNVIHAYGPDTVVIGGGVMNSHEIFLPEVVKLVHQRAWTVPRKSVKIVAAKLGNRAAALGAAFHFKSEYRHSV
jgi:glucokinase